MMNLCCDESKYIIYFLHLFRDKVYQSRMPPRKLKSKI